MTRFYLLIAFRFGFFTGKLAVLFTILISTLLSLASLAHASNFRQTAGIPQITERGKSGANAELRLQSSEYISRGQNYFRDGAGGGNTSVSIGTDSLFLWRKFGARLKARDEYSGVENWNYLNIYDASVAWRLSPNTSLALGRKLDRWDEWEEDWRQGVFQPRYMQNRLRSESAGLTGAFLTRQAGASAFTLGFLPVNIPDLGAHFSVQDNQFTSRNPWFNPPARQFVFRQVTGEIRYSLDKPSLEEVANHPGGVAKYEYQPSPKYLARFSAAYKPMPQLLLGFPSRNRVVVSAVGDYMSVRVTPRVAYHSVFSHDSVARVGPWTATGSLAREVPDEHSSEESSTAAQVRSAWISALSLSRPLEEDGPFAARLKLGFFKVKGGDAPDRGDFASNRTLFERRYQYSEAYMLALSKPLRGWTGRFPLDSELRVIYDRLQNGGVVSFNLGHNFTRDLRADLEVDVLGLMAGSAEIEDGFLALYRANDRVGLGISYVY